MNNIKTVIGVLLALLYIPLLVNTWSGLMSSRQVNSLRDLHFAEGKKAESDNNYTKALIAYQRAQGFAPGDVALALDVMRTRAMILADDPASVRADTAMSMVVLGLL